MHKSYSTYGLCILFLYLSHKILAHLHIITYFCKVISINIPTMRAKNNRMEILKMLISSKELGSQEELLRALSEEGYNITQATLSRDLKQLKVAKAASMNGKYVYVLPNETMYKRLSSPVSMKEMMQSTGFRSINFSGNMVVIKTRPGYASSIAYNIDNSNIPQILGTIAGDDTIFMVKGVGVSNDEVIEGLRHILPNIEY